MIKNFEPRLYQETIVHTCVLKNTLVVLPTGLGKTNIFLMLAAHRLTQYPNSKILFIGPTRPLIDQYLLVFKNHFEIDESQMAIFTGHVSPEKRGVLWEQSKIIFSTPQGLENDIISNRIALEDVSLLGIDEAHRGIGEYAYVFVAKQYVKKAKNPRIIALTASPGSDMQKIKDVCRNLFIEGIEVRTDTDPDVRPYVHDTKKEWVSVELTPPFLDIMPHLKAFLGTRLAKLNELGVIKELDEHYLKKAELIGLAGELRARLASGEKDFSVMTALSLMAEIMKMSHALELLETQGIPALQKYIQKLYAEAKTSSTKAIQSIMADVNFKSVVIKSQRYFEEKIEHPKLIGLQKIIQSELQKNPHLKIIIFNQYRDNALDILEKISAMEGVAAHIFVGQQKKGATGLSQKEQKRLLDEFREGKFNVLIATSIGEEGLDVPRVDIVIFYEPIPSVIRHIQRAGRTGRQEKGNVIILMAKNTRDEAYRWVAHHKEKQMYRNLESLKRNIVLTPEKTLLSYTQKSPEPNTPPLMVYADYREKGSGTIKELVDKNVVVKLERLESADYVLSPRVGAEFKTVEDFAQSIIDGRLLTQLKELKHNFERPLIIVEGPRDLYGARNIHANAIRGMLITITVRYGIPILFTNNPKETAALLYAVAQKEQEETGSAFTLHATKKPLSLTEQQEYIISALPGVGSTLAKPLLRQFGSVKNVVNATLYELQQVEKIGPLKAGQIHDIVSLPYERRDGEEKQ